MTAADLQARKSACIYCNMHLCSCTYLHARRHCLLKLHMFPQGCNGGQSYLASEWITKNGGIVSAADYPYIGKRQKCKATSSMAVAAKALQWRDVPASMASMLEVRKSSKPGETLTAIWPLSTTFEAGFTIMYLCNSWIHWFVLWLVISASKEERVSCDKSNKSAQDIHA